LEKEDLGQEAGEDRTGSQNEFLNLVLESLPHPFYVIDASDYRIKVANTAAQLNPLSKDSTCYALTHKRDKPCGSVAHPCPVEEIKKTKQPVTLEHVHFDRDGNPRNVQIYAYPILDTAGNVSQIIEYSLDITEQKQIEETLERSEEKYRSLVESSEEVIAVVNSRGVFEFVNHKGSQSFGERPEDFVGKTMFDLFPKEIAERQINNIKSAIQSGNRETHENPTIVNGEQRWYQTSIQPIKDKSGKIDSATIIALDITELKQIQEALWRSEEQHRLLVETMNEGFSMVDENQLRTYANKRLCEMLGYEVDEIAGVPATKILDETNKKLFKEEFTKRRKGESGAYEITFTGKDGQKVPAIVSPRPIFNEKGQFKGSFSVITDVTDLKHTQQALKKREKELEMQTDNLEEANAALRVLLKKREEDKKELEEKVLFNMSELVEPYLEKLKNSEMDERQKTILDILESNLNNIISPFSRNLYFSYLNLTPAEMQIAALIRQGRTTKETASMLNVSSRTVETHRKNIRKKLGLTEKKANLRTKLLSLQ
jgi:PAS domain S-box-containing protein